MKSPANSLLLLLFVLTLAGCAAREPVHKLPEIDARDLPRALGCASNEVAFCAGTNCRPADYSCVSREQVLGGIWAGPPR